MNVLAGLRVLVGRVAIWRSRPRRRMTADERAARRYWDDQVDEDHKRRGVNDKHA